MEWLISKRGDATAIPDYNCSEILPVGKEWSHQKGEKQIVLGIISLVYGIFVEIVYTPCMIVIAQKANIRLSCFKIMFLLGVVDMCAIALNSIGCGYLMIEGAVFCTYPTTIFIIGSLCLGIWCCACFVCLILVLNRILVILYPTVAKQYFSGHRTTLILLIPIAYGLYFFFFTPPALFNSNHHALFFDPFIFEGRTWAYQNYSHIANNLFIVVSTCMLYGFFCTAISRQFRQRLHSAHTRSHASVFIQSTIICMANFIAATIYVYIQFFEVADFVIVIGHISWQLGHGCPAVIYLFMNRTIKRGVFNLIRLKSPQSITGISAIGNANRVALSSSDL